MSNDKSKDSLGEQIGEVLDTVFWQGETQGGDSDAYYIADEDVATIKALVADFLRKILPERMEVMGIEGPGNVSYREGNNAAIDQLITNAKEEGVEL